METLKLRTRVGSDGMLKLEVLTSMTNRDIEVMMVAENPMDALGG